MPTPLTSLEVLGECATLAKAETANPAGSPSEHTEACRHLFQHDQQKHGKLCRVVVDDCGASCKANVCAMCAALARCICSILWDVYTTKVQRGQATCPEPPSLFRGNPGSKCRRSSLTSMLCFIITSSLVSQMTLSLLTILRGNSLQAAKFLWAEAKICFPPEDQQP